MSNDDATDRPQTERDPRLKMSGEPSTRNGYIDVPFGDKPHEVFNLQLMTIFVQNLYREHRQWFGANLLETIGAERKMRQ